MELQEIMNNYCEIIVPEEINYKITTIRIEKIISKLISFKKAGVQVLHLSGAIKRLQEFPEVLKELAKEVSIFVDYPENLPNNVRKYIENA